jgi:hypothetical protein
MNTDELREIATAERISKRLKEAESLLGKVYDCDGLAHTPLRESIGEFVGVSK